MEDRYIVDLYHKRSEAAIEETARKYGRYCKYIANNILYDEGEADECVVDTYCAAWNSIPPHKPTKLSAFLGKLTRNLAISRWRKMKAQKRFDGAPLPLDELAEVVGDGECGDSSLVESLAIRTVLDGFLASLKREWRIVFVQRYFYMCQLDEISQNTGLSQSNIKMILHRLRQKLKEKLTEGGIEI